MSPVLCPFWIHDDSAFKIHNMLFPHPIEDVNDFQKFHWQVQEGSAHWWTVAFVPTGNDTRKQTRGKHQWFQNEIPHYFWDFLTAPVKRLCVCHKSFMAVPMLMEAMIKWRTRIIEKSDVPLLIFVWGFHTPHLDMSNNEASYLFPWRCIILWKTSYPTHKPLMHSIFASHYLESLQKNSTKNILLSGICCMRYQPAAQQHLGMGIIIEVRWLFLFGGFNPSEKYLSNWTSSPNRGENKKYLKPPPSYFITWTNISTARLDKVIRHRLDGTIATSAMKSWITYGK